MPIGPIDYDNSKPSWHEDNQAALQQKELLRRSDEEWGKKQAEPVVFPVGLRGFSFFCVGLIFLMVAGSKTWEWSHGEISVWWWLWQVFVVGVICSLWTVVIAKFFYRKYLVWWLLLFGIYYLWSYR